MYDTKSSFNRITVIGNLGQDPKIHSEDENGNARFVVGSVATTAGYKTKEGELKEETTWHKLLMNGRTAMYAAKFLKKGAKVLVEGRLQIRESEKDGVKYVNPEIVVINISTLSRAPDSDQPKVEATTKVISEGVSDDDIPF